MTSIAHLYSDFSSLGGLQAKVDVGSLPEETLAEDDLATFETGYQAGWDDAISAKERETQQIDAAFLQQVQDMSFTYHEAFSKLARAMRPLMTRFVTKLLPDLAQRSLPAIIMEQIDRQTSTLSENAIELVVAPEVHGPVARLLEDRPDVPFLIEEDPSLGRTQAYLRVNEAEQEINLDAIIEEVGAAIEAFYETPQMELTHG